MSELAGMKCVPCRGGEPPLDQDGIRRLQSSISGWELVEIDAIPRLKRTFEFKDFAQALAFTNLVGEIAEQEGHHPALLTEWGKVTVSWWTHKIKGLHQNDFIMAAKCDRLYESG